MPNYRGRNAAGELGPVETASSRITGLRGGWSTRETDAVGILWPLAAYRGAAGAAGVIEADDQIAFRRGEHCHEITGKTPEAISLAKYQDE
jgi:hypothetical protein